jgi:predicted DNA-binding transcriptional regulator AlpA
MNLLKIMEVSALTRRSKPAIYRDIQAGLMPKQIKLGPRSSGWVADEVRAVIAARIAGVDADGIKMLVNRLHEDRRKGEPHAIR